MRLFYSNLDAEFVGYEICITEVKKKNKTKFFRFILQAFLFNT